jgi:hypothetical protein
MAEEQTADPKTPSSDYTASNHYWNMVNSILSGVEAMRAIEGYGNAPNVAGPAIPFAHIAMLNRGLLRTTSGRGSPYLPQFPNETDADYTMRLRHAPMANIYSDISRNLSSKPFSKTLELDKDTADDLKKLAENIDGQGNNLHVFSREVFKAGLDKGIDWILIDYTDVPLGITLEAERGIGASPYWVHVPAERLIAVYSAFFNGKEIITHARIYEAYMERNGYSEEQAERVRVFNREEIEDADGNTLGFAPATWELFELVESKDGGGKTSVDWMSVDNGDITIGIIPLVPFRTGTRNGSSWHIEPPLRDVAYMQVEEFQQESNLKTIKELTAFPMVTGNGVTPPTGQDGKDVFVPVGPRAVLFAPPNSTGRPGQWAFIEPSGTSLNFLKADLEALKTEMRDLGMQPLSTANLTVITTANVSMKAHSAVQAWAIGLKDSLEQAWKITCMWLGRPDESPVVKVHTDFGVDIEAGTELADLLKAEAQGVLSKETVQEEFKRRGVLSDDFDIEAEAEQLAKEQQGLVPEQAIDPVTGAIMQPSTRPRLVTQPGAPKLAPSLN